MTRPEREEVIAKVREALDAELVEQASSWEERKQQIALINTQALAEAAFDTLIEAWFPPF